MQIFKYYELVINKVFPSFQLFWSLENLFFKVMRENLFILFLFSVIQFPCSRMLVLIVILYNKWILFEFFRLHEDKMIIKWHVCIFCGKVAVFTGSYGEFSSSERSSPYVQWWTNISHLFIKIPKLQNQNPLTLFYQKAFLNFGSYI